MFIVVVSDGGCDEGIASELTTLQTSFTCLWPRFITGQELITLSKPGKKY